ncbi:MAG: hypothetical protein ACWA5P_10325 [bacterium]
MQNSSDDFKKQLEEIQEKSVLSSKYRTKKLIIYLVRTLIAVLIFYFLWDKSWIKWALYIYIPLNLFSLVSIFGWTYFLKKQVNNTKEKLAELDELLLEEEE